MTSDKRICSNSAWALLVDHAVRLRQLGPSRRWMRSSSRRTSSCRCATACRWRPTFICRRATARLPDQRWPTILMRTPYDKQGAKADGEYFARHGYAFVVQDTRGRYASEGVWHMLTDDGRDGFDTCAWIGRQSLVQRQDRHDRHLVRRRHAARPGDGTAAATGDRRFRSTRCRTWAIASMRNGGAFELRFWNWIHVDRRARRAAGRRAIRPPPPCSRR